MHKRRLIRRYINQDDLKRLLLSGQHLYPNSPYYYRDCEWGLIIDNVVVLNTMNAEQTDAIFRSARTSTHSLTGAPAPITMVPGMRLVIGPNGYPLDDGRALPNATEWENLTDVLRRIIFGWEGGRPLVDENKRVIFDIENYSGTKEELMFNDPRVDVIAQDTWSREFFNLIREHDIIPMVLPGAIDAYLSRRIFSASNGRGVAMLEAFGSGEQLESYLTDHDYYVGTKHSQFVVESLRWKRQYPRIKVSWMTSEMVLRQSTAPWRSVGEGAWDITQSMDDLSWVYDEYRLVDTNEGNGRGADETDFTRWNQLNKDTGVIGPVDYNFNPRALGSIRHYYQDYGSQPEDLPLAKVSNNVGLVHVWQFGNTPDLTDRITSVHARRDSMEYRDRFWRGFYSAHYDSNAHNCQYEEDPKTVPGSAAYSILRRGIQSRYFVLGGAPAVDARKKATEPWIALPAGIDTMDEWSVCLTLIVHGQEYGADGLTPWTRGMSLLNRWWSNSVDQFQYFHTELFALDGVAHMRLRVKFKNDAGVLATEVRTLRLPSVDMSSNLKFKVLVSMKKVPEWTWRFGCVQEMEEVLPDRTVITHFGPKDPSDPLSRVRLGELRLPVGSSMPSALYNLEVGNWGALGMRSEVHDANREGFEALPEWPIPDPIPPATVTTGWPNAVCIGNREVNPPLPGWPETDVLQHGSLYGVEIIDCAVWNKFGTMIPFSPGEKLSGDQWPYNSWVLDEAAIAGWIVPESGT